MPGDNALPPPPYGSTDMWRDLEASRNLMQGNPLPDGQGVNVNQEFSLTSYGALLMQLNEGWQPSDGPTPFAPAVPAGPTGPAAGGMGEADLHFITPQEACAYLHCRGSLNRFGPAAQDLHPCRIFERIGDAFMNASFQGLRGNEWFLQKLASLAATYTLMLGEREMADFFRTLDTRDLAALKKTANCLWVLAGLDDGQAAQMQAPTLQALHDMLNMRATGPVTSADALETLRLRQVFCSGHQPPANEPPQPVPQHPGTSTAPQTNRPSTRPVKRALETDATSQVPEPSAKRRQEPVPRLDFMLTATQKLPTRETIMTLTDEDAKAKAYTEWTETLVQGAGVTTYGKTNFERGFELLLRRPHQSMDRFMYESEMTLWAAREVRRVFSLNFTQGGDRDTRTRLLATALSYPPGGVTLISRSIGAMQALRDRCHNPEVCEGLRAIHEQLSASNLLEGEEATRVLLDSAEAGDPQGTLIRCMGTVLQKSPGLLEELSSAYMLLFRGAGCGEPLAVAVNDFLKALSAPTHTTVEQTLAAIGLGASV